MPPWVVTTIATFAVLACLAAVLRLLLTGKFSSLVQYRIVLALLSFALSTISCVLFVANAKMELDIGYAVITLVGPAVIWIAVILVLSYVWKEDFGSSSRRMPPGWIPFAEWRLQHGTLNYLFDSDMLQYCIKEVFNNVFFRYPAKSKLSHPHVQTVFVYYRRQNQSPGMVKFQRVSGKSKKQDNGVDLYHVSAPSLPGQDPSSFLFIRSGATVLNALSRGDGDETWHRLYATEVETLVVAHCPEGNPPEGDYLWVDVPKYTVDDTVVDITFLSQTAILDEGDAETRLWEVTHSAADFDEQLDQIVDVPVAFLRRRTRGVNKRNPSEHYPVTDLTEWLGELDHFVSNPVRVPKLADAHRFLLDVRSTLQSATGAEQGAGFAQLLAAENFPHTCRFSAAGVRNPVMAFIQWLQ